MRLPIVFAFILCLAVSGCYTPSNLRGESAMRIASPAFMIERVYTAGRFELALFERMHQRGAPANIYIGGDGNANRTDYHKAKDPTPENPVALNLAALDKAENVAFIARPCQYTGMPNYHKSVTHEEEECDKAYWNEKSFSEEVIKAYEFMLDDLRGRYGIREFNLIGHSGGGAIAAILATKRDDVVSLRTVAGNLDHMAQADYHGLPNWHGSLNAKDFASELRRIPQIHFIGGQDENVPPAVLHSYLQAIGKSSCVKFELIQEAEHQRGWADKWPELLRGHKPACAGRVPDL